MRPPLGSSVFFDMPASLNSGVFATAICPEVWNRQMGMTADTRSSTSAVGCASSFRKLWSYPHATTAPLSPISFFFIYCFNTETISPKSLQPERSAKEENCENIAIWLCASIKDGISVFPCRSIRSASASASRSASSSVPTYAIFPSFTHTASGASSSFTMVRISPP